MKKIVIEILRYGVLLLLVAGIAFALPIATISQNLLDGLTDEDIYEGMVEAIGIGPIVGNLVMKSAGAIPGIDFKTALSTLNNKDNVQTAKVSQAVEAAIDKTAVTIVSQIPAFMAGERDQIRAEVDLKPAKLIAAEIASATLPAGDLLGFQIEQGIDNAVPDGVSLDEELDSLENMLLPVRLSISGLRKTIRKMRATAWILLALVALVAFRIHKAALWIGMSLLLSGTMAGLAGGLVEWTLDLILPDIIFENHFFDALFVSAFTNLSTTGWVWISLSGCMILCSLTSPLYVPSFVALCSKTPVGPIWSFLEPKDVRASLSTLVAAPVAIGVFAFSDKAISTPRRSAKAALVGRTVSATLLDYTVLPVLIWGVGKLLGELLFFELLGHLAALPLWLAAFIYWALRDNPRKCSGFNFTDRLAGVVRGRFPGKRTRASSLVRATPLLGAALLSLFLPIHIAFPVICTIDLWGTIRSNGEQTTGDLWAGTRTRLIRQGKPSGGRKH